MHTNVFRRGRGLWIVLAAAAALLPLSCSKTAKPPETAEKEAAAKSDVTLPSGAMSLSAVLAAVEKSGYAPVVEVEFEKDHWKIKAYRDGRLLQLKVDLFKGEVLPDPPPTLEKPLSAIIKGLEDQGYGPIVDVERAAGGSEGGAAWEVEAYKGKSEITLSVEAGSGKITAK
jgi:hypothetical protein